MAFQTILDWLVAALILTIGTIVAQYTAAAIIRGLNRSEKSDESIGYTYWYTQSIFTSVAANRRRLARIERKIDQAITELQKAQEREVAHRQELAAQVSELHWILQGIRNRQQGQGRHLARISHEQHTSEDRLTNYLRDIRRDLTYWYDTQPAGNNNNNVPEYETHGPTIGEQQNEHGSNPNDWNLPTDEAAWSLEGNTDSTIAVTPVGTTEESALGIEITPVIEQLTAEAEEQEPAQELEAIEEVPEPSEGLFQDYLGPAHEHYRHPDSPKSENEDLSEDEVETSTSGTVFTLIPIPLPNGEVRSLEELRSFGQLGHASILAGGRRSSTELATPRLDGRDTSSRNQIATPNAGLLVVYQYRDSSSEESSDTSQAPTESIHNNTDNEEDDEGKHLVKTYGSDSEEEEA